jgi:hypothetical protein
MAHSPPNVTEQRPPGLPPRNRLEIIRFRSREDHIKAIDVLLPLGMLNFSSSVVGQWAVRTEVVRALRAGGVPFDWLTENA